MVQRAVVRRVSWVRKVTSEAGQTTAEYALVLMGAGAIAFLLIAWANGGAVKKLFDGALEYLMKAM
jgi:Flp pilus assembly pilin Flp